MVSRATPRHSRISELEPADEGVQLPRQLLQLVGVDLDTPAVGGYLAGRDIDVGDLPGNLADDRRAVGNVVVDLADALRGLGDAVGDLVVGRRLLFFAVGQGHILVPAFLRLLEILLVVIDEIAILL